MKIEILDSAEEDLIDGFKFYENQSRGLGDYFLDSLFSDIESLRVYAGITPSEYRDRWVKKMSQQAKSDEVVDDSTTALEAELTLRQRR